MGQPVGDFNIDINIFLLSPVGVAGSDRVCSWCNCGVYFCVTIFCACVYVYKKC